MQRNKNQVGKKLHFYFGTFQHFNVDIYKEKVRYIERGLVKSILTVEKVDRYAQRCLHEVLINLMRDRGLNNAV